MAGIFNGIGDTLTGGGGAPGSNLNPLATQMYVNASLENINDWFPMLRAQAFEQANRQYETNRQALSPVLQQLGFEIGGYTPSGAPTGIRYIGTEAQKGLDRTAQMGWAAMPQQYANLGYDFRFNDAGGYDITERADSQRNQFLDAMGREIGTAGSIRDQALQQLYASMGQQGESIDATRRALQTAEASQVGALQQLGFYRDAAGNIVKNDGSPLSQYERMLLEQANTARGTQRAGLSNLGYWMDAAGNVSFDPNSSIGQMFAQLDQLRAGAAGQTRLAGDTQAAALQRLGLRQGAGGWENDPAANEAMMRALQGDYLRRAQAAMQGNAPVDPGVERALAQEEQSMRETLTRQLGPGWENSSAGIEALRNFRQRANETRYRVQQDALGLGTQQAMGLQGINLQTLASLYASNDPVLRAIATESAAVQAAQQARLANASTASSLSAQGAGTVANLAGTQSNINAQTLAALYGLTAPALAAAGQLGNLTNANLAANQSAYGNIGNLGQQVQQAITGRAQGAMNFANLNNAALSSIPASLQQLYAGANAGRMSAVSGLYPALSSAYGDTGTQSLMELVARAGGIGGQLGLGTGQQVLEGEFGKYQTNINNIFWQNFMKSFGQSAGSYVGSGGMGGM